MFYKLKFFFFYKKYNLFYLFYFNNYYLLFFVKRLYFMWYNVMNLSKKINYYGLFFLFVIKQQFIFNSFFFSKLIFYFCEFFLDGLYYRVKYYKEYHILGFILGFNHYILYRLPVNVKVYVHMKKRRFFLYTLNLNLLGNISNELVNLKFPNLFKGKGLKILINNYRKKNILKKIK